MMDLHMQSTKYIIMEGYKLFLYLNILFINNRIKLFF